MRGEAKGALQDEAEGSGARIVLVETGTYSGTLRPASDKTIIGLGPGVVIQGNVSISGSGVSNVILRNIAIKVAAVTSDDCGSGIRVRSPIDRAAAPRKKARAPARPRPFRTDIVFK